MLSKLGGLTASIDSLYNFSLSYFKDSTKSQTLDTNYSKRQ